MGTTYKYDTLPVAAVGTNVNLLDLLKQAYGDEVSEIRSVKVGYFDGEYMNSLNFTYWDDGTPRAYTKVSGNGNVPSISGSSTADSSLVAPASLTAIDSAHFKDVTIEVGNSIMSNVHLQIDWGTGVVQDLAVPTVRPSMQSFSSVFNRLDHPGAPTANDIVIAAEYIAKKEAAATTFNPNDCDWIAKDIAAVAGATMDANTWHPDNPALNEEGGFWRIEYRGSDPGQLVDWQTRVKPGDIVRMGWKDGGQHTVTVTAGLNADGAHAKQIEVVDNTAGAGGNMIGEHWADFNSRTKPDSITIYRLAWDGLYLINGSSESDTIVGSVWNDDIRGGSGWDVLHGGAGNDYLEGEDGQDILDGGAGADNMLGGRDSDIYHVDNEGDVVSELGVIGGIVGDMGGTDEVVTTLLHRDLPSSGGWSGDIENLTFNGTGSFSGSGNALNNVIRGGDGGNTLDGGAGADTMIGGTGDDVYYIDNPGDVVVEGSLWGDLGGTDEIRTTLSTHPLPSIYAWLGNIENLTYIGTGQFIGTGNELANTITGGAGQDTLDGGGGADTLIGKGNDDTYKVDNTADRVIENVNEGYDIVKSTATIYTLSANVEELDYIGPGTANFVGTGNALNNLIIGGDGNDTLDGGGGADTMYGGKGNDVYRVDSNADLVVEGGFDAFGKFIDFGGIDEIRTTTSLTLRTENGAYGNIEKLTFVGTGNFAGTGNGLDNVITGAAGADILIGGGGKDTLIGSGGNDTLDGGAGNDTLTGGTGRDTFHFNDHWGTDIISDFKAAEGDIIDFRDLTGVSSLSQLHPVDTTQGIQLTTGTDSITLSGVHTFNDSMFRFAFTQDDFTADRVSDILFHNDGNGDSVYYDIRNTISHWTTIGTLPPSYAAVGTGDFGGGHTADILFQNAATGDIGYYHVHADSLRRDWYDLGTAPSAGYKFVAAGDFTGLGKSEALFRNDATGDVGFFKTNSNGSSAGWTPVGKSGLEFSAVGAGDFNGHGRDDILFRNNNSGDLGYWEIDSSNKVSWNVFSMTPGESLGRKVAGIGDFNHDGIQDILMSKSSNGFLDVGCYDVSSGKAVWHEFGILSTSAMSVAAVGDYDGNHTSDVLLYQGSNGDVGYYGIKNFATDIDPVTHSAWHDIGLTSTAYHIVA